MNLRKIFKRFIKGVCIMLLGIFVTCVGGYIGGNEVVKDIIMLVGVVVSLKGFVTIFRDDED